jgi:hypothetical protein
MHRTGSGALSDTHSKSWNYHASIVRLLPIGRSKSVLIDDPGRQHYALISARDALSKIPLIVSHWQ